MNCSAGVLAGIFAGTALALGCGHAPEHSGPHADEHAGLVWPPPPEPARVRLLQVVTGPEDLIASSGVFARLRDAIAGAPQERFVAPSAVAVDEGLGLAVADTGIPAIHVFDWAQGRYQVITGDEEHPLHSPVAVAIGPLTPEPVIWVSDSERAAIIAFTPEGEFVREIRDEGRLLRPAGLAVDAEHGELIVVDVLAHDVKRYGLDGAFHGSFGGQGSEAGQFNFPTHLFRFPDGRLAVTDSLNFRVQVLAPDGAPLAAIGQLGDAPGCLSRPKGVVADGEGNLWVVDALFENLQAFDAQGNLLLHVGGPGNGPGDLWLPAGLAIDAHGRLYVADTHNRRVQIFELVPLAPAPSPPGGGGEEGLRP